MKRCKMIQSDWKNSEFWKEKLRKFNFWKKWLHLPLSSLNLNQKTTKTVFTCGIDHLILDQTPLCCLFSIQLHTIEIYGNSPFSTNPLVFPFFTSFLSLLFPPFLLPFRFYFLCHLYLIHMCVCINMYASMWLSICVSAFMFACVRVCVCTSHPRNPSASHLWHSQQSRKQAPPPTGSQQPMGGLVWDYLGTWVAGGPVSQFRQMHDKTHFACRRTGYESTMKATSTMWKSYVVLKVSLLLQKWIWWTISPKVPTFFPIGSRTSDHCRATSWDPRWNTCSRSIHYF